MFLKIDLVAVCSGYPLVSSKLAKILGSLIELSRDITEISPLWELLPFNLS